MTAQDTTQEEMCDPDWIPYKDEKCIKIFPEDFQQYSDAKTFCNSMGSSYSLLSVNNAEEQVYFHDFIHVTSKIKNSVWLGLRARNGLFTWPDGSPLGYTNWINGSTTDNNSKCVELTVSGKWLAVSCTRRNMFVCETHQIWSMYKIQKTFQEFRKEQLDNPVPVEFIYVQLSDQPDPQVLWPAVIWEQISEKYAGLFFRAEGLGSTAFNGGVQNENTPRLVSLESAFYAATSAPVYYQANVLYGGWSNRFITGEACPGTSPFYYTRINHSGGEVRPRNEAIRIWKRIR